MLKEQEHIKDDNDLLTVTTKQLQKYVPMSLEEYHKILKNCYPKLDTSNVGEEVFNIRKNIYRYVRQLLPDTEVIGEQVLPDTRGIGEVQLNVYIPKYKLAVEYDCK